MAREWLEVGYRNIGIVDLELLLQRYGGLKLEGYFVDFLWPETSMELFFKNQGSN
jgi:hypothetical protein